MEATWSTAEGNLDGIRDDLLFTGFQRNLGGWENIFFLIPERRFVAGFFRRLLAYLTPCISISIIPHISIQHASHQDVSHQYVSQYVSIQCVSIQKVGTYPVNTYLFHTYPFNTYPTNTYPFNAYPFNVYRFKRFASAGMAMYVNAKQILAYHCISRNGNVCECKTYPCISLHQQEWQWVWVSLHVISYHCYSAGMAMKI